MGNLTERWLPIPGFEGLYDVSDMGRVRSSRAGRVRSATAHPSGHLKIQLHKNGVRHDWYVHQLVLLAFVGPCPEGMEGCHFPDRSPSNNRLDNLRWDTRSGNRRDAIAHGTAFAARIRCPRDHPLSGANLVPSKFAQGVRECLSCNRAHIWVKRNGGDLQTESDRRYALLETTNAPPK